MNNFFADGFVVKCVAHIISKTKVIRWVMYFCIYNYVLLLSLFFFVKAYESSQPEIGNGNDSVVMHSNFPSIEVNVSYVSARKKSIKLTRLRGLSFFLRQLQGVSEIELNMYNLLLPK